MKRFYSLRISVIFLVNVFHFFGFNLQNVNFARRNGQTRHLFARYENEQQRPTFQINQRAKHKNNFVL
jgi:hypothetical protein